MLQDFLTSNMPWKRPESVPKAQVWLQFQGKQRDGSPGLKYQIRDLDPDHRDECLALMMETFVRDEPLCKVLGISNDPLSVSQIKADWELFIDQGISIACYTEENDQPKELVGFNILVVKSQDDKDELYGVQGESWKKLLKTLEAAEKLVDVFSHYGVRSYLSSSGLTVKPQFRGQNIGARMFEARKPLCTALGLTASATVFTAKTSQVLAKKCGYELLGTLEYSSMKKLGVDLSSCDTPTAELRGIRF